jgi:hypothetical protein
MVWWVIGWFVSDICFSAITRVLACFWISAQVDRPGR